MNKIFYIILLSCSCSSSYCALELYDAIQDGNLIKFERLIEEKDIDITTERLFGKSLISLAFEYNHINIIKYLINKGISVNSSDITGIFPLHWAALKCYPRIVRLLISKGAEVNKVDNGGNTPINYALKIKSCKNDRKIVRYLIKKGADVNFPDKDGQMPIIRASIYGHCKIVQYLINAGALANKTDKHGWDSLYYAIYNDDKKVIKVLINSNSYKISATNSKETVFDIAIKEKHRKKAINLVIAKMALDACKDEHIDELISLIKKYTKLALHFKDSKKETLLHIIIANGSDSVIKNILVLTYGLVNIKNKLGQTPIMLAAQKGPEFLDIFMQLIKPDTSVV